MPDLSSALHIASSELTLAIGDTVEIAGAVYQVRDVRAIGDGTERRASLSQF